MGTRLVRFATVCIACSTLLLARASEAGPITLNTSANAAISPGFFDQDSLSDSLSAFTNLELTSTASGTFIQSNLTADLDVSAYAFVRVAGGSLSVGIETQSNGSTTIGAGGPVGATTSSGIANAGLDVSDSLTVVGGPTSGTLALNFAISGSLSTATSGSASFANNAAVNATFSVNSSANLQTLNAFSQNGPGGDTGPSFLTFPLTWTVLVPYTNSSANMDLHLDSMAVTNDNCSGAGSCTELAWGALGQTFTLGSIQVLDESGQLVTGAYALGGSGIVYNNLVESVPDTASTAMLLAFSVVALSLAAKRS